MISEMGALASVSTEFFFIQSRVNSSTYSRASCHRSDCGSGVSAVTDVRSEVEAMRAGWCSLPVGDGPRDATADDPRGSTWPFEGADLFWVVGIKPNGWPLSSAGDFEVVTCLRGLEASCCALLRFFQWMRNERQPPPKSTAMP